MSSLYTSSICPKPSAKYRICDKVVVCDDDMDGYSNVADSSANEAAGIVLVRYNNLKDVVTY